MYTKLRSRFINTACRYGGFRLARLLTAHRPRILMYHRFSQAEENNKVSAAIFDRQMTELKQNFKVLPLSAAVDAVRQRKTIPRNTIVITIDDGYEDFYRVAYPILKRHDLPATIYVTTDFIDGKLWLWPDKVSYILHHTVKQGLTSPQHGDGNSVLSLQTTADRARAWSILIAHCLTLGDAVRSDYIDNLARELAVKLPAVPVPKYAPMTWDAVCEVADNGIEIGAHTRTHPVLSLLDAESLRAEVLGSKQRIEQITGKTVTAFCYPNGQPDDYNDRVKRMVEDSGFTSATAAFHDKAGWRDLYEIRRYGVGQGMMQFRKGIYGVEYLSTLLR